MRRAAPVDCRQLPYFSCIPQRVSIDDQEILEGVRKVPIRAWRYRGDGNRHVGPMADAFNSAFGLGSKTHIPVVDAIGVLWAAIQALSDKLDAVAK